VPFAKGFENQDIFVLPIDDHIRSGYSHSAVLAKGISKYISPIYGALRAKNRIRYSGQKLSIRQKRREILSLHVEAL